MSARPIRLITGFLTVGGWTLASRVLGFVREIMILAFIGPGPLLDAFVAAFRLPNLFRRFFAEGAFNAAFVPMYSKRAEAGENADDFAREAFNGLAMVVLALVALGMVFMPALVWATAEGFRGDARFDIAVGYGRIVFPYIFFMSLAALFSGVLNANGRFATAAAAPVLLNILAIVAMGVGAFSGGEVINWLLWAIPLAGAAQLALVWYATERAGVKIRPGRPRWSPEMKHLVAVGLPAALANGVVQINLVVGQLVASRTEGAVSWLFAADRLYQLPLGVVGIAVGIVLLPELSRRLKSGDDAGAKASFSRAGEFSMVLTLPCAVAFLVVPLPLVSVLYERGATDAADSAAIASALAIYGLGLPAFVLQKLQQPLFFAREDTRSPFHYALVAMVVNAGLAFGLLPVLGWLAPAVAATTSAWVMSGLLFIGARKFGDVAQFDARYLSRIVRIIAASLAMGAFLWALAWGLAPMMQADGWRYLALAVLITVGIGGYGLAGQALGAFRMSEFQSALRRS
jgi:putative peptidoglycan lipid II flippase